MTSTRNILTFLLLAAILLPACNRSSPPPPTSAQTRSPEKSTTPAAASTSLAAPTPTPDLLRGTVSLWHSWDEADVPFLVQVIDDFQSQHPDVMFDVLYVPQEDLQARYLAAAAEQRPPGLLLAPATWGPALAAQVALADLTGQLDGASLADINPAALASGEFQDAQLSVPYRQQGVVLYRNLLLVAESPATFDELVSLATSSTQGDRIGAVLDRGFTFSAGHLIGIGGQLMDADGQPAFNSAAGLAWMKLLQDFDRAGPAVFNSDEDAAAFKEGRVGFVIDGTWNLKAFSEALEPGNLAIDPWPSLDQGSLAGFVQSDSIYLSAHTAGDDQRAALAFIEYLLSPSVQASLAENGWIPVTRKLAVKDPLISQAMVALSGGVAYPTQPEMPLYAAPLDVALKSVFDGAAAPDQALQAADEAVRQAISTQAAASPAAP